MKILFIFARPAPYDSVSVRVKPSGGTEKAAIFLGEAFQKLGHKVEWITTTDQLRAYQGSPDIVITQVAELLEGFPNAKKIWWTHHFADQPVIQQNAAFARCFADHVVTLSQCHADDFRRNLRIESTTIGHGVWCSEIHGQCLPGTWSADRKTYEFGGWARDPYRLIYASTPFRGLDEIPGLFREIKTREPRATIAICSSMATYGTPEEDKKYQKLFDELAEIPGVELKGALNQAQLYAEYSRASIFFYPCIWPETYCLAMDEAIAHGCHPVVTNVGALGERVAGLPEALLVETALAMMPKADDRATTTDIWPQDWLEIAKQWEREVLV